MAEEGTEGRIVGGNATRVVSTGLALVHENEVIYAAPGSEAQAERLVQDAGSVVQYHFPVEIEVRELGEPLDTDALVERTLAALTQSVRGLGA